MQVQVLPPGVSVALINTFFPGLMINVNVDVNVNVRPGPCCADALGSSYCESFKLAGYCNADSELYRSSNPLPPPPHVHPPSTITVSLHELRSGRFCLAERRQVT